MFFLSCGLSSQSRYLTRPKSSQSFTEVRIHQTAPVSKTNCDRLVPSEILETGLQSSPRECDDLCRHRRLCDTDDRGGRTECGYTRNGDFSGVAGAFGSEAVLTEVSENFDFMAEDCKFP